MSSTAADYSQKLSITPDKYTIWRGAKDTLTLSVSNLTGSWVWIEAIETSVPVGPNTRDLMKDHQSLSMKASVTRNSINVAWNCSQAVVAGQCKITVYPPSSSQDGYALSTQDILNIGLTFDVNPNADNGDIQVTARAAATENGEYLEQNVQLSIKAIALQVSNFNCTPAFALYGQKLVLSFEATEAPVGLEIKYIGSKHAVYSITSFKKDAYKYWTTFDSSFLANNLDTHFFGLCNAQGVELLSTHIEFYTPFQIISCPENLAFGSPLKLEWVVKLDDSSDFSLVVNSFALRWNGGPPQPIQPVLAGDAYSLEIRVPSYICIGNLQLELSAQFQTRAGEELISSVWQIGTVSYQYLTIPSKAASIRNENGSQITTRDISSSGYREAIDAAIAITMIQIPAGAFTMGSPESEGSYDEERPQHLVSLPSFFLGQAPVTQAQWTVVAAWQKVEKDLSMYPSYFKGPDLPVDSVSWEEAMEFCKRLSLKTGRHYTLPSEAQWEYACRAGSSTPFAFGETLTPVLANYLDGKTSAVGIFPANAWGLHDMHGNVWEWCLDSWHDNYNGAPSDGSSWDLGESRLRLLRGGSWGFFPRYCRAAYRAHDRPDNAYNYVGFRVVCLPQGPSLNS